MLRALGRQAAPWAAAGPACAAALAGGGPLGALAQRGPAPATQAAWYSSDEFKVRRPGARVWPRWAGWAPPLAPPLAANCRLLHLQPA